MAGIRNGETRARRRRDIAFFNHGEDSVSAQEVKNPKKRKKEAKWNAGKESGYRSYAALIARALATTLAGIFSTLTLVGLLLRGMGSACKHVPLPYCSRPTFAMQEPLAERLAPGTTPITKILHEVIKLNNMSTSLEFIDLAMRAASDNISAVTTEIERQPRVYCIPEDDMQSVHAAIESSGRTVANFQELDQSYRQTDFPWSRHRLIRGVGVTNYKNLILLNDTSNLSLTIYEHILTRSPVGLPLVAQRMNDYFAFTEEQRPPIEKLANISGQTTLTLGSFQSSLESLQRQVKVIAVKRTTRRVADVLEVIENAQAAVQWVEDVAKLAETSYKNLLAEVRVAAYSLQEEVRSYSRLFPSKQVLPTRKLYEMLEAEHAQLDAYVKNTLHLERIVKDVKWKIDRDMAAQYKFEAAFRNRQLLDWW